MSVPQFADVGKASKDLLTKDFPVGVVKLDVKTPASADGVSFTIAGSKSITKDSKATGIFGELKTKYVPKRGGYPTLTAAVNSKDVMTLEAEMPDLFTKGLKVNVPISFSQFRHPSVGLAVEYKHKLLTSNTAIDLTGGPAFSTNAVVSSNGFLVGGDVGYNVSEGRVTKYNAALGYNGGSYNIALHATNMMQVFSLSHYQRISPVFEVGGRVAYNTKAQVTPFEVEAGMKYALDKDSFLKAKIDDAGKVGLGYTQTLMPGVKLTLAGLVDTASPSGGNNKVGVGISFE